MWKKTFDRVDKADCWIFLAFVTVISAGFRRAISPLDFWWHLKVGEIMVETRSIPRVDSFSFTAEGQLFVLQNWLVEIWYYLVYLLGGFETLVFANALVVGLALIPIYLVCRAAAPSKGWAALGTLFASYYLAMFSLMRPQTFSILLFALFFWILTEHRRRDGRLIWLLPALMLLWVNLHGAFILGFLLVALFCADALWRSLFGEQSDIASGRPQLRRLVAGLILALAATLANPEGYRLWDYVLTVLSDPASRNFVSEWQPPAITSWVHALHLFLPLFLLPMLFLESQRRPGFLERLLYVAFAALALASLRNLVWWGIVAAPLLAAAAGRVEWSRVSRTLSRRVPQTGFQSFLFKDTDDRPFKLLVLLVGIVLLVASNPWLLPVLRDRPRETALFHSDTPVRTVEFLSEREATGNIFNHQRFGDYLIWRRGPTQRVFIDGRVHLFGREIVEEFIEIHYDSCWEDRLVPWEIRYLLLAPDSRLATKARESPNWTLVLEEEAAVLFERDPTPDKGG